MGLMESVDAYKVCKERIDAVEKALEKALGDTTSDTPESTRAVRPVPPPDMEEEEDLPF